MSWATISTAIATTLAGVPSIAPPAGAILTYEPNLNRHEEYVAHFGNAAGTAINGWYMTRDGLNDEEQETGQRFRRRHSIVLTGVFSLTGDAVASEPAFQAIVEDVLDSLRADQTVWVDHPEDVSMAGGALIGHRVHGSYFIHSAEIRIQVDEYSEVAS